MQKVTRGQLYNTKMLVTSNVVGPLEFVLLAVKGSTGTANYDTVKLPLGSFEGGANSLAH